MIFDQFNYAYSAQPFTWFRQSLPGNPTLDVHIKWHKIIEVLFVSRRYTINPLTRYGMRILTKTDLPEERVRHLIDTGSLCSELESSPATSKNRRSLPNQSSGSLKHSVTSSLQRHSVSCVALAEDRQFQGDDVIGFS